jgi:hypothetical protein
MGGRCCSRTFDTYAELSAYFVLIDVGAECWRVHNNAVHMCLYEQKGIRCCLMCVCVALLHGAHTAVRTWSNGTGRKTYLRVSCECRTAMVVLVFDICRIAQHEHHHGMPAGGMCW